MLPAILRKDLNSWFKLNNDSPYMLLVDKVKESRRLRAKKTNSFGLDLLYSKRSIIPAVTHVDLSARIQTVHSETNKFFP